MIDALIGILFFLGFDWLAATRVASYYTDFDYAYWPPSTNRAVSIAFMSLAIFMIVYRGPNKPLWEILPLGAATTYWVGAILANIIKQRREYVPPPPSDRYGG